MRRQRPSGEGVGCFFFVIVVQRIVVFTVRRLVGN